MSDNQDPRERYADVLGEEPERGQMRLIEDIRALYPLRQPPRSVALSVGRAVREEGTVARGTESVRDAGAGRPGVARHRWPFLQPLRRGLGAAGLAGFALMVLAIAVGLSAMLSRMDQARGGDVATVLGDRHPGVAAGGVSNAPASPVSPLLSGAGVLHIKGTALSRAVQGDVMTKAELEFWYDRATGNARLEQTVLGVPGSKSVYIREGQTDLYYRPSTGATYLERDVLLSGVSRPVWRLFMYKLQLDRRQLEPSVAVSAPAGQIAAVPPGGKGGVAYLDQATGLTRRVTGLRLRGRDASLEYEYSAVETLDSSVLPADLFSIRAITPEQPTDVIPAAPPAEPTAIPNATVTVVP